MGNKAVIVGAGVGGIATSILLAKNGYSVDIFEKNSYAGGRCSGFVKDGHRFDAGATMLMMPQVFKDIYASFDKNFTEEIDLYRMDPTYRVWFKDVKVDFTSDLVRLKPQFESVEKGSYNNFLNYLNSSSKAFDLALRNFINRNFYSIFDMLNIRNLSMFAKIRAHTTYYKAVNKYFKSETLRHIFTLQSLYLGLNPAKTPGVFFSLPEMELSEGVYFPKGGMRKITENLISIAEGYGVKIHLNSEVKSVSVEKGNAVGIVLKNDAFHRAETFVINADLPYSYKNLLPEDSFVRKIEKKDYTCSALVFHWGMDNLFPQLEQHNVFISPDHKKYLNSVFEGGDFPEDPTFYLHSPARKDKSAAPEGCDSITVIIPIANLDDENNWEELKKVARKGIIDRLEKEGIQDVEKHIKFETVFTPHNWLNIFNLSKGSTFGSLSHKLLQMGYFRPNNQHRKIKNLFFVGGSTHPGNGVPMTLISARLTTEKILKKQQY